MGRNRKILCFLALGCLAACVATPVRADVVTFSTGGSFSVNGTNTISASKTAKLLGIGPSGTETLSITYNNVQNVSVDTQTLASHFVSLGSFTILNTGPGWVGTTLNPTGNFGLTVNQALPTLGANALAGTLGGTINFNSLGLATIQFSPTNVTIGNVTYTLNLLGGNTLNLPSPNSLRNPMTVALTATVTVKSLLTAAPEPSTLAGASLALIGLVGYGWRRRRRTA